MKYTLSIIKIPFLYFLLCGFILFQIGFFISPLKWDALDAFLPWRYSISEMIRNGNMPWWSSYQHLGFPIHADPEAGAWYPVIWIFSLFKVYDPALLNLEYILHLSIAGYGVYLICKDLKLDKYISFSTGVAFMLCGFFISNAQNFIFVVAMSWFPLIIRNLRLLLIECSWKRAFLFAVFLSLAFTGGYPGMLIIIVYSCLALILYFLYFHSINYKKCFFLLCFSGLLFFLLCFGYFFSIYTYIEYFNRSVGINYDLASENPFSYKSIISFLLPAVLCCGKSINWNTDITMNNAYFGLFPLLYCITWVFNKEKTRKEIVLVLSAIFILFISFGAQTPVHYALFKFIPGINLFRHPSIFRPFFIFCLLLLYVKFHTRNSKNSNDPAYFNKVIYTIGIILLVGIVYLISNIANVFSALAQYWNSPEALNEDIKSPLQLIALIIPVSLLILYIALRRTNKLNNFVFSLLMLFDSAVMAILLMPLTISNSQISMQVMQNEFHRLPKGFNLYQKQKMADLHEGTSHLSIPGIWRNTNTYIKQPAYDGFNSFQLSSFNRYESTPFFLHGLKNPMVYLSNKIMPLPNIMDSLSIRLDSTTLFAEVSGFSGKHLAENKVEYLNLLPNNIEAGITLSDSACVTVVQNPHPNWKLYVNGEQKSYFVSNHTLMSIILPKGKYHLKYAYLPKLGRVMTFLFFFSWIAVFLVCLYFGVKCFFEKRVV